MNRLFEITQNKKRASLIIVTSFLIGFFFVRFPSLNLIGPIRSHMIVKILIAITFCFILTYPNNTLKSFFKSTFSFVLLLYFLSRTFGIINAVDPNAFVTGFQRFFFGFVCFYIGVYCSERKEFSSYFSSIIIGTAMVSSCIDLCLYFFPQPTLHMLRLFVNQDLFHFIQANVERGRTPFSMVSEASIPFLFLMWYTNKDSRLKQFLSFPFSLILVLGAFLSSWRIRLIEFCFSLIISWLYLFRKIQRKIVFVLFFLIMIGSIFFVFYYVSYTKSTSLIDRTTSSFDEDATRPKLWKKAWETGLSFPITGIGFDNFIYYFTDQTENLFSSTLFQNKKLLTNLVHQSPHNIIFTHITESGLLGGVIFFSLLLFFIHQDLILLTKKDTSLFFIAAVIIQFWTLVIFGMFHPTDSTEFYCLFFLSRGIIQGKEIELRLIKKS